MKNINITICLYICIPVLFPNFIVKAQNSSFDQFEGWSEQRCKEYSDSIYNALYPGAIYKEASDSIVDIDTVINDEQIDNNGTVNHSEEPHFYAEIKNNVGEIEIESGMTPSGAKTYNIPLKALPGVNGFNPELSISYNSQQGNSSVGYGWELSGMPKITRGHKNVYYDGIADGQSTVYFIDGHRLIEISRNDNIVLYESEIGKIKVKSYKNNNISFEAFYPDGRRAEFGYGNDFFPIKSLYDIHGNSINYTYTVDNGCNLITAIDYNKEELNGEAICQIKFNYQDREDKCPIYFGGLGSTLSKLLKSIEFVYDTEPQHTYILDYLFKDNKSLLKSVAFEADEFSCNPLTFSYGYNQSNSSFNIQTTRFSKYFKFEKPNELKIIRGKFDYHKDNDGLIVLNNFPSFWYDYIYNKGYTVSNKYAEDDKILIYTDIDESYSTVSEMNVGKGFVDIFCADVDGYMNESIIKINNYVDFQGNDHIVFEVYGINAITGHALRYIRNYNALTAYKDECGNNCVQTKKFFSGDFDGDGVDEILGLFTTGTHSPITSEKGCVLYDLKDNQVYSLSNDIEFNFQIPGVHVGSNVDWIKRNSDKVLIFDYDGDGKSDICHIHENGTDVYTLDSSDLYYTLKKIASKQNLTRNLGESYILPGDYNGDRLADILLSPTEKDSYVWTLLNSNGAGGFVESTFSQIKNPTGENNGFLSIDLNNDNCTDLILYSNNMFTMYQAQNNKIISGTIPIGNYNKETDAIFVPANINKQTNIISIKDNTIVKYNNSQDLAKSALLTEMTNSYGVREVNRYDDIKKDIPGKYTSGQGALFPYVNISEKIQVITNSRIYDVTNLVKDNTYTYYNAILHRQGLGFCGFEKIIKTDIDGLVYTSLYDPFNRGVLISESSPTCKKDYTYDIMRNPNKTLFVRLLELTEEDLLKGISCVTNYEYGLFDYPTKETKNYSNGYSTKSLKTYAHDSEVKSGYNLGYIINEVLETTTPSGTVSKAITVNSHSKRQPLELIESVDGNQTKRTIFEYDSYGNIISDQEYLYESGTPLTETFEYDLYNRLNKHVDKKGVATTYLYHPYSYTLHQKITKYGREIRNYDPLGRLTSVVYPDSTKRTIRYEWAIDANNLIGINYDGVYAIIDSCCGKPTQVKVYDRFKRMVRKGEIRFDGKMRKIDRIYDHNGNVISQSEPFTSASPTLWNTFSYDNYNRMLSSMTASGNETLLSYNGLNISSSENGLTTTKVSDVFGNLVSVSSPHGTVSYVYAADGQPISITSNSVKTEFEYDDYRRQTSIIDPSHGTSTIEYDESGNISKKTDANNVSISYEYDEFNNMVAKISPEFRVDISIYENEVEFIDSSNGITKWFDHDDLGRIVCIEESGLDGLNFKKDFTYSNGNISSIHYTSNRGLDVTENRFYANGHLCEVKLNNDKTIFKLLKENERGLPIEVQTGNVLRKYEYDEYGFPTRRLAKKGDNIIQDYSYEFDTYRSNLLSWTDNTRDLIELYDYDDADRLVEYGTETAQYDIRGNITSKSDVGTFGYNNSKKPYALTDVSLINSNSISTDKQQIEYASFSRPLKITEGYNSAEFFYDGEYDCSKIEEKAFNVRINICYYSNGCYEYRIGPSTTTERLYLIGDYYSSPVVIINEKEDGTNLYHNEICHIIRDYSGSITHVIFNDIDKCYEYNYDAWGRMRNPQTLELLNYNTMPYLGRGYGGHVHLSQFKLINMNARLYDPVVGRFLSPDPYVQNSDWAANYNRYSYALNNPYKYKDQSGEFFGTILTAVYDLFRNVFTRGTNIKHYSWDKTVNAFKIDLGMFQGSFLQIVNKWTWGYFTSAIGNIVSHAYNILGKVDGVTELDGMLALSGATSGNSAVTIGHYSLGPKNYTATWKDNLFVHEYGHYIQAQQWGPAFFAVIGIPSLMSAAFIDDLSDIEHKYRWFEVNASRLGASHFARKYGNGEGEDYFNIDVFTGKIGSLYENPRFGGAKYQDKYFPINHSDIKNTIWDYIIL